MPGTNGVAPRDDKLVEMFFDGCDPATEVRQRFSLPCKLALKSLLAIGLVGAKIPNPPEHERPALPKIAVDSRC
jgi:hypothetical protein